MFRKGIALVVMLLFVGMSIVPSMGGIVEDDSPCDCKSGEINSSYATTECENIWYIIRYYEGGIGLFIGYNYLLCSLTGLIDFPEGITCRNDAIIAVDSIGDIYEINPNNCNVSFLGSTGVDEFVDIEYDAQEDMLWGISTDNFYGINTTTYEATLIGPMGNPSTMISLAGDTNGNIWALELNFGGGLFYEIDKTTGEANLIGNTGISTNFDPDMSYDTCDEIIYWCAFNYATFQDELWTINVTNAQSTYVGILVGHITLFAISYGWSNQHPIAEFTWTPKIPNPGKTILFNASESIDYDGNITLYEWDWDNDGVYDESHSISTATHSWSVEGHYPVALRVTDDKGLKSVRRIKTVIVDNNPPDAPTIDGPTNGGKGIEYDYIFHATEPNGDDVFYYIDWGDKTYSGWIGPYANCTNVTVSHTWDKRGTYRIGCLAKDSHNHQGEWGYLEVTMPKNLQASNVWFLRWLESFPILQKILDVLRLNN